MKVPGPGLGRGWAGIKYFEITGAGTGKIENAGAGPGSEFFFIAGTEPGFKIFYCRVGIYFFYCRGRGRAGIGIFFIAGAGPGFNFFYCRGRDFFLLPGPGRDLNFFYCRGRGRAGLGWD